MKKIAYDEQNDVVRYETIGTLQCDGSSPKHNNRIIEMDRIIRLGSYYPSDYAATAVIDSNGIAPTVRENHGQVTATMKVERLGNIYNENAGTSHAGNVWDRNNISPSITTCQGGGKEPIIVTEEKAINMNKDNWIWKIGDDYYRIRIRKLTPKECWRLMGFDDDDFEKAEKVCSNSQLYKQAGNSICVPVLENILKQLI